MVEPSRLSSTTWQTQTLLAITGGGATLSGLIVLLARSCPSAAQVVLAGLLLGGLLLYFALILFQQNTQLEALNQDLAHSLSILKTTLESTADGIIVLDRSWHITHHNQKFLELWRLAAVQINDRDDRQLVQFMQAQVLEPEAFIQQVDAEYHDPTLSDRSLWTFADGRVLERYSQPHWSSDGIIGRVVSYRDVTDRQQAEIALWEETQRQSIVLSIQQEIASNSLQLDEIMTLIVNQTQQLTRASGAVIEFLEGSELVYRAASGVAANYVGLRLDLKASFSGRCLETGEMLYCQDSESDDRVDLVACRTIGVRAMIAVPLLHQNTRIGVLKVVSATPSAFTRQDMQILQLMTGFLSAEISMALELEAKQVALAALQDSEERYRSVVIALSEGIVMQDAQGVICASNASAERILGLSADQLAGRTSIDPRWQAIHEDGSAFSGQDHPAMTTLQTGRPCTGVIMGICQLSGNLTWISINTHPLMRAGESLPYAVVTSFMDITDRKQAEALLRQSERRYRGIVEDQTELIVRYLSDGTLTFVNKAYCRYFGVAKAAIIGERYEPLIFEDDRQQVAQLVRSICQENPVVVIENRVIVNGEVRWTQWINRGLFDLQGHLLELQAVGRDITELKRVEAALTRLAAIVASSDDAIISKDINGKVISWNHGAEKLFGYAAAEMEGHSLTILFPPDNWQEELQILERVKQGESIEHYESIRRRKDGTLIDVSLTISPVRDAEGNIVGAAKIARDISDRKRTEAALRQSEARFQTFMNHSPTSAWITDAAGRMLYVNQTYLQMFQLPTQDLIGKTVFEIYAAEFAQEFLENIRRVAHTQQVIETIESAPRPDQTIGSFLVYKFPILGVQEQCLVGGVAIDITERNQAEAALQESEQRLQLAFEGSGDGLWDWNITTGEVYLSPRYLEMLGYAVGDLPHDMSAWERLIHSEDRAWVLECLNAHLQDQSIPYRFDYRVLTQSGHWKWIANYGKVVVWDDAGQPLRMTGVHRDIDDRKQAEQALFQREQEFRALVENSPDVIARLDRHLRHCYVNPMIEAKTGRSPADYLGKTPEELGNAESLSTLWNAVQRAFATRQPQAIEFESPSSIHAATFSYSRIVPEIAKDGAVETVLIVTRDITTLKQVEQALYHEKELAQVTLQSIGDAVITTDALGNIEYFNPVAESLTGWQRHEVQGLPLKAIFNIVHETTRQPVENPIEQALLQNRIVGLASHTTLIARNGGEIAIEDSAAPIHNHAGEIIGAVMVFHDVTQTRALSQQLVWQASHDALTGLVNRREFECQLEQALSNAKTFNHKHALCYLDLDRFKIVNDTCGHAAGDELLRQVTALLQDRIRKTDVLARLGGDEFGVLLHRCPPEQALRVANALRESLQNFRFVCQGQSFAIGASMGLVGVTAESESLASLLSSADAACYTAKNKGRNRVHVFQPDDEDLLQQRGEMQWVNRLTQALENDCFCLYYQPIAAITDTGLCIDHYEVLLRLRDTQGSLISPMAFIPAAERYNLMHQIDRWVIRTLFSQWATAASQSPGIYAINLSGASLNDEEFIGFLYEQFATHQIPPQSICFEITETIAIANLMKTNQLMREFQRLGCRFALDDFGSGMSSFGYLKNLAVDYLKIDGGFIKNIAADPVDAAMVEAITRIGHVMGIKTIAEFVENDAILERIKHIGVDYAQGYGIAAPCHYLN